MQDQPTLLLPGSFSEDDLHELRSGNKIWRVADIYDRQLEELAEIFYPDGNAQKRQEFITQKRTGNLAGAWVYYPWSGVLLHCVGKEDLFVLRTNRNKNLIIAEEQSTLAAATVAVAGMSVGSGIALACVYSGISETIKLADFDELETANLNRLREALADIGTQKADLAKRHVYEINPFAEVQVFGRLDTDSIEDFLRGPTPSVIVDEIDDFKMKVRLRLKAKEMGVPLIMFTSLGDNILIDIERYDRDSGLPIFNGAIDGVAEEILGSEEISEADLKRYAIRLVGQDYVPTKAIGSLLEIGKSLVGRPQLYSTIAVDGGLATYLISSIVLGRPVASGRYFVKFSELVGLPATDLQNTEDRGRLLRNLLGGK